MPKEYIEREAVRTAYKKSLENNTHKKQGASAIHIQEHNHILHIIDKLPTADVVEVVRCRDCRMATEDIMIDGWFHCDNNSQTHKPDHFCGYGTRKDK
jgi:hypothetical protein